MRHLAAVLLTVLAVLAARDSHAQGTGEWVRADGARVYLPCPRASEYGARTRIPASCRVAHPGILYTVERDARAEVDALHLAAAIDEARELRILLDDDRAALDRMRRELEGLAAEHDTLAAQLQAAEAAAARADRDRRAAEARERSFSWGDAALGAGVGGLLGAGLVFVLVTR